MAIQLELFDGLGPKAGVDHVAIQVATGQLTAATMLFRRLGFSEDRDRRKTGEWGEARHMVKEGSIPVQLIHATSTVIILPSENHVALAVLDPSAVAQQVADQAFRWGKEADIEEVPGGKYFVTIPGLLTTSLEFVPFAPLP